METPPILQPLTRQLERNEAAETKGTHCVYVVRLSEEVREKKKFVTANLGSDPEKPCYYVGLTGLTPEKRFKNHKAGYKASRWVRDFGIELIPQLYEPLGRMPYETAAQMEERLAKYLRSLGYAVWQK